MANLNIQVNFLADNAGTPGQVITNPTFEIGDRFFVEVLMGNTEPSPVGLISSAINVKFNGANLQSLSSFPGSIALDNPLVTPSFPMFRNGILDNLNGSITNLSGGSFPAFGLGSVIGVNKLDRFSLMHFETISSGNSNFNLDIDLSQTSFANGSLAATTQNQFTTAIVILPEDNPPSVAEPSPTLGLLLIATVMLMGIFRFRRNALNL